MATTMDPDCRAGKHSNCAGEGWDDDADAPGPCPCICHEPQPDACSGEESCAATWHRHGCEQDTAGDCDHPAQHVIAAETPRQPTISKRS